MSKSKIANIGDPGPGVGIHDVDLGGVCKVEPARRGIQSDGIYPPSPLSEYDLMSL